MLSCNKLHCASGLLDMIVEIVAAGVVTPETENGFAVSGSANGRRLVNGSANAKRRVSGSGRGKGSLHVRGKGSGNVHGAGKTRNGVNGYAHDP